MTVELISFSLNYLMITPYIFVVTVQWDKLRNKTLWININIGKSYSTHVDEYNRCIKPHCNAFLQRSRD